jgi:hypothetical protein
MPDSEVIPVLDMEELAEVLGRPVEELKRMPVKADPRTLEALKKGSAHIVRAEPKVISPRTLRANFHTVAHHGKPPPDTAQSPATSPEDMMAQLGKTAKTVQSRYQQMHPKLRKKALSIRPPGAPSILQELKAPVKLIIHQSQSPGDIMMLTAAVRDLHASYPGKFITEMRTSSKDLWEHNPNQTKLNDKDKDVHRMYAEYPLIQTSNTGSNHFVRGFLKDMESKLGLPIRPGDFRGDIHLGDGEKRWYSQVYEILQKQVPFWIIDAGHKMDFTAKHWDTPRYQKVVDSLPDIYFVQVGAKGANHNHPRLTGDNVIDLVGKTSIRKMVRLMYNACGVITPISFPMHLAAAVEVHPWYKRKHRPCVVLAGGREPAVWEQYSNHQFLHTCGMLPCNIKGGCWKSRTVPVGDGDKKDTAGLCERPVKTKDNTIIPLCMDMITPEQVVDKILGYTRHFDYSSEDPSEWGPRKYEGFPEEVVELRDKALKRTKKKTKTKGQ